MDIKARKHNCFVFYMCVIKNLVILHLLKLDGVAPLITDPTPTSFTTTTDEPKDNPSMGIS